MKFLYLLLSFLTLQLIPSNVLANQSNFSLFGPCQQRCITKYGEERTRRTNIDTLYREFEVFNNTDYSLCRLGCTHPEFTTLNLPEFLYGQSAYQEISDGPHSAKGREHVVKEVNLLCLDQLSEDFVGKVSVVFDDSVEKESNFVHYVELISHDEKDGQESIAYRNWCYNPTCNINFTESSYTDFRLRISSFDRDRAVGHRLSKWYSTQKIRSSTSKTSLNGVEWNDERAAARFAFDSDSHVPVCSFQVKYKNATSNEYKIVDFKLDHTNEILVKDLEFNQNYTMSFVRNGGEESEPISVRVPACTDMVPDVTMCAPPPVSGICSTWNITSPDERALAIDWNYFSVLDGNSNRLDRPIRTSHFRFSVFPLITSNNPECEKYEPIHRDVYYTNRRTVFKVPNAKCDYEVEVTVFDTKRRKSETRRIKIVRVNEPSFMALLPSSEIPITIGFVILLTCIMIIITLIILIVLLKKRNHSRRRRQGEIGCYAHVEEPARLVGGKPHGFRFKSVENVNRNVEAGHGALGCNNQDGVVKGNVLVLPQQPYGDNESDHLYDYILDNHVESEMSDEVFEEDICISTPNTPFRPMDSPAFCLMAPIAPFEEFDDLPAYAFQNFRFGKPYERAGNPYCLMTTAMDVSRGRCYSLKYPRDYSEPARRALRRELEILRVLPIHKNLVQFDGVVIGRWENIPYQITGILMEECQGGTLYDYINAAGFALRRSGMRTPDDPPASKSELSPNPSSGYDSFTSKGRQTPEQKEKSSCQQVSSTLISFAQQLSSALEHLHFVRIVHSRVSSVSMYLSCDYNDPLEMPHEQSVKLGDFSHAFPNTNDASALDPMLQPPEVMLGKKFESKGDIWQMGMCLVEMCTIGVPYAMQKHIPTSGVPEYDKLPSTRMLRDTAKKCLKLRNRPTAQSLHEEFYNYTG